MAVILKYSENAAGSPLSDVLAGGEIGVDLGNVSNGSYTPIGSGQTTNDGKQDLFLSHDAVVDPIEDVKIFMQPITLALTSGNTYGGAKNATQDNADLIFMGNASGGSKDNSDGLSGGIWAEFDWQVNNTNRFAQTSRPTLVKIFGDNNTDGINASSAFAVPVESMSYWNGGIEAVASGPVAGKIGKTSDTVLGNRAHIQTRIFVPSSWPDGGKVQWAWGVTFTFTA